MNTVACYKTAPDNQDIAWDVDQGIDVSRAAYVIGEYDLMAVEAAVQVAEATEGRCVLLSAGGDALRDTKLTKAALSRGASELFCVVDEELTRSDAYQTACVLAAALRKIDFDLVLCGEGSSDRYEQQVGPLLGALLEVPMLNAVSSIAPGKSNDGEGSGAHGDSGTSVAVERTLENEVETLEVALPAVISVTADINLPRIPQLKDILAAGKKPVTTWALDEVGGLPASPVKTMSVRAPESVERKQVIYESSSAENVAALVADIRAAW